MRGLRASRRAQSGVILFIALIVLVAMTLAGIALMRSVDTNVLVAGNLAFRQGTTLAGDWGIEEARTWLNTNTGNTLYTSQPGVTDGTSYFANFQSGVDLLGVGTAADDFNWTSAGSAARNLGTDAAGNEVRYIIHRLCQFDGDPNSAAANCVRFSGGGGSAAASTGTKGVVGYGTAALPGVSTVYYRVTVRVAGPRNTLSFVQAILN
jgi:type IV pilus assembly protein PilX